MNPVEAALRPTTPARLGAKGVLGLAVTEWQLWQRWRNSAPPSGAEAAVAAVPAARRAVEARSTGAAKANNFIEALCVWKLGASRRPGL